MSAEKELSELEKKILREANKEYFAGKFDCCVKHRITEAQAKCVIRALLKNSIPALSE